MYNNYPNYTPNYTPTYPTTSQPLTNKIYVTSLEDALSRFASPNTITVYFLQDETALYEIYTDFHGKKTIKTRKISDLEPTKPKKKANADFITRAEFDEFKAQFDKSKVTEEEDYVE